MDEQPELYPNLGEVEGSNKVIRDLVLKAVGDNGSVSLRITGTSRTIEATVHHVMKPARRNELRARLITATGPAILHIPFEETSVASIEIYEATLTSTDPSSTE